MTDTDRKTLAESLARAVPELAAQAERFDAAVRAILAGMQAVAPTGLQSGWVGKLYVPRDAPLDLGLGEVAESEAVRALAAIKLIATKATGTMPVFSVVDAMRRIELIAERPDRASHGVSEQREAAEEARQLVKEVETMIELIGTNSGARSAARDLVRRLAARLAPPVTFHMTTGHADAVRDAGERRFYPVSIQPPMQAYERARGGMTVQAAAAVPPRNDVIAWAVVANVDGEWVPQFPMRPTEALARFDLSMYGNDTSTLDVWPLVRLAPFDPSRLGPTRKAAFEWLRGVALAEGAPSHASVAIVAWHEALDRPPFDPEDIPDEFACAYAERLADKIAALDPVDGFLVIRRTDFVDLAADMLKEDPPPRSFAPCGTCREPAQCMENGECIVPPRAPR